MLLAQELGRRTHNQRRVLALALCVLIVTAALLLTACGGGGGATGGGGSNAEGPPRDTTPVVLEASQPGLNVVDDGRAVLDYSNTAEGYISVKSNLGDTKVKVLVDVAGAQYQYTIESGGTFIAIPLSEGNGTYAVGVWQNVTGDSYAAVFSQNVDVVLDDELQPFIRPNQLVNFFAGDEATSLSQQLAEGSVTDVDALNKIYNWVCDNITYDIQEAVTVASGYLPNNADTIASKKGICFDYAVLTSSMLRAQRIPSKLVIGFAGSAYHAWIEVYCVDTGTVKHYIFNGNEWVRMDPTFDAAASVPLNLSSVIGDETNYKPMFYY